MMIYNMEIKASQCVEYDELIIIQIQLLITVS